MAIPFPPVACRASAPFEKLAEPLTPNAVLSVERKVAAVKAWGAPPSVVIVPASKSTSMRLCTTPELSKTSSVVLPVKPETAVGRSRPVSRPVSCEGGGTALEALWMALIWLTAWVTYSPSWAPIAGSWMLRASRRPRSSPPLGSMARGLPPGEATEISPAAVLVFE